MSGSDGCHICFAALECARGVRGQSLDGAIVVIREIVLSDGPNSSKWALLHRNRIYAMNEVSAAGRKKGLSLDDSDEEQQAKAMKCLGFRTAIDNKIND